MTVLAKSRLGGDWLDTPVESSGVVQSRRKLDRLPPRNPKVSSAAGSVMPRFFLHLFDGRQVLKDDEGFDFPNVQVAREEAVRSLEEIAAADLESGERAKDYYVEIHDDSGQCIITVPFAEPSAGNR